MSLRRTLSLAAASLTTLGSVVLLGTPGCSSAAPPSTDPVAQGLSWMDGVDQVANSLQTIDSTSTEGKTLLSAVDTAVSGCAALQQWVDEAGTSTGSTVMEITPEAGSSGTIAQRTWITGSSKDPTSWSAVVSVTPPAGSGEPFVYAEQHVYSAGYVDNGTVWMIEGGQFVQVATSSFVPSQAAASDALTSSSLRLGEGLEPLGSGDCAGLVCNPSQLTNPDGGKLVSSPQGGGSITAGCRTCVYGMYAVQLAKAAINLFGGSGQGGSETGCALVGTKTGPAGAATCEVAAKTIGAAPATPNTFNTAAQACNYMSDTVLGLGTACPGYSTPGDNYGGPGGAGSGS